MTTLHEIRDNDKVAKIANDMERNGWTGYPVLTIARGDEHVALTGVHRIAASEKAEIIPETYNIDEPIMGDDDDINSLWEDLADAIDDDDRLSAIKALYEAGEVDGYALEIMQAEVAAQ